MPIYTTEKLKAMSANDRLSLRNNALNKGTPEALTLARQIDELKLPLGSGGLTEDHPLYQEMYGIIMSPEGKAAALNAVEAGLPAMAGVDPLLQERMGKRYNNEQQMTVNAGYITGSVMISLGYEKHKEGVTLPAGCVARSSTTWKLKRPLK
ncbi:hypothetical protein MEX01_48130 [Methylorubrum extorquens]|uniref:hypothetical protein n=1 Tax=Methylorubrum extorquens TaxID=408 RepID=UPI00117170EB|nr:hypothetical protein [Methylorubrum extorquens]GEL44222.1 hypothetical protein MEX01_48130 [Methylorubrum extorquens]